MYVLYVGGDILSSDPANFGSSESASSLVDVSCPLSFSSFSECMFNVTDEGVCGNPSNRLLVQCTPGNNEMNMCFGSTTVNLASRVDINSMNEYYAIGYPQLCSAEGVYSTVCADILNDFEAEQFCNNAGYSVGSVGPTYGTENDYRLSLTPQGVFDYSCPDDSFGIYDCTFNFTSDVGCTEDGGVELVTCSNGGKSIRTVH